MKKISAFCMSIITALTLTSSLNVSAEEVDVPKFYFKVNDNENIEYVTENQKNIIRIDRDSLQESGLTLNIGVYIKDESLKCWSVSPKWKSNSELITLNNLVNPYGVISDTPIEYENSLGEKFQTDKTPCAYASINSNGEMILGNTIVTNSVNNLAFTCYSAGKAMGILGATTDEYPLTSFDAVIDNNISDGIYEIYFLTNKNSQDNVSMIGYENPPSPKPEVENLTIIIDNYDNLMGDVDYDGKISPLDATMILSSYAKTATGQESELTDAQKLIADSDGNGKVDVIDATIILNYYAYKAIGGTDSFVEYLNSRLAN